MTDDSARSLDSVRRALDGRYRIDRLLGRGGMGAVYLARDMTLDRPVALKVLPQEFAIVAELRERFLRETRTAAGFSHPNIVPVFSVEDHPGLLAFAMGYVEGESLSERVRRGGALSVKELVGVLQDIGYALAYAHGRGVVHRDIKPDNIMIERATGRALLMDFGISRTITVQPATQGLTRVGEVVGTPEFMSPEQAAGDELTGRSDLYSLGLVAWFAATGQLAISGDSTHKIIVRQITETIPSVRAHRSDLPAALGDLIDACVVKDPDQRVASAETLVETLDAARLGGPDVPLPVRLFAQEASQAGLVLVGGLVIAVLLAFVTTAIFDSDLDAVVPVMLFLALLWGRLAQTFQEARRLVRRGFGRAEVQRGLSAVLAERDAERAQLRADPLVVARRRRQVMLLSAVLASSIVARWYVVTYQRVMLEPGYYKVTGLGIVLTYASIVALGVSIIGLLRSPLRRRAGEWLFRGFWLGPLGGAVLSLASRGIPLRETGGVTAGSVTGGARATVAPVLAAATPAPAGAALGARLERIEARLDRLEESAPSKGPT